MSSYWTPYYEARDMDRDWEEVGRDWGRSGVFGNLPNGFCQYFPRLEVDLPSSLPILGFCAS